MGQPKPGSEEWQKQLNSEVEKHDDQFAKDNPDWDQQHGSQSGGK